MLLKTVHFSMIAAAASVAMLLSGCGGGGGNVRSLTGGNMLPMRTVALPAAHDLANWLAANPGGIVTVPAGEHRDIGGVRFSCPAGGDACEVSVMDDDAVTATSTGGMALAAPVPPPVYTVGLPAEHDLANWLTDNPGGMVTVPAGERRDVGRVRFSCPAGGADCAVAVTSAHGSTMVSSAGGMATAESHSAILNRIFQSADSLLVRNFVNSSRPWIDLFPVRCSGATCTQDTKWLTVGGQRLPFELSEPRTIMLSDLTDEIMDWSAATETHRGVSLLSGVSETPLDSVGDFLLVYGVGDSLGKVTGYSGWLDHSFFNVAHGTFFPSAARLAEDVRVTARFTEAARILEARLAKEDRLAEAARIAEARLAEARIPEELLEVAARHAEAVRIAEARYAEEVRIAEARFAKEVEEVEEVEEVSRFFATAMSIGDVTGTNPTSVIGNATWSGVMVGVDVSTTESESNRIQGDADLTIVDFTDPKLDVAFTNISDVDAGRRRADMTWNDVPLTDGNFRTWSDGNSIEGEFYGPNHEEVGGIFERDQVMGAFGAQSDTMLLRPVGNGGNPMRVEPAKVRSLTGSAAPTFSREDVLPAFNRIARRANSILVSDVIDFSQDPPVRGQTTCSGTRCEATVERSGYYSKWDWEVREISESNHLAVDAVAEFRGISLAQIVNPYRIQSFATYGGWLDHSYCSVSGEFDGRTQRLSEDVEATSFGYATGTNPVSGGASWHGVMVGRDVNETVAHGNAVQGNAEVTIADFANPRIGVAFTSIKDLNTGGSRGDMTWSGISLASGGFATGSDGNSIQGKFYGPNHEEAGGVFERDQVIGAFGAKRP